MSSPTQRSLALCKKKGWPAQVVERWISLPGHPGGGVRKDLFGAIDIVALPGDPTGRRDACLGIQACSGGDAAKRLAKARAIPEITAWLNAGCNFEVWAWRKAGARGKRKLWRVRVVGLLRDGGTYELEIDNA